MISFASPLPFQPDGRQILYVERYYHNRFNADLQADYDKICRRLSEWGYRFLYVPRMADELAQDAAAVHYYAPSPLPLRRLTTVQLTEALPLADVPMPAFVLFDEDGGVQMQPVQEHVPMAVQMSQFVAEREAQAERHRADALCVRTASSPAPEPCGAAYDRTEAGFSEEDIAEDISGGEAESTYAGSAAARPSLMPTADALFSEQVMLLLGEVRDRVRQLKRQGVEDWIIRQFLLADVTLSRLVVTPNYRLILPDFQELEVSMTPLPRAVYLLFLRHAEGIPFKSLPDYRAELSELYLHVCRRDDMDCIRESVKRVTDPFDNSINEKCARIREAFVRHFEDSIARNYYVTGGRGEPKRVLLDRSLLEWRA